jgi:site-specific recombinase XerD
MFCGQIQARATCALGDGAPLRHAPRSRGQGWRRAYRSTFARLWRRLAEAAGLPPAKWHPHIAKHTTGTLLARSGASAFLIRQRLGHRSISSSQVYCTVSDRDASAAAQAAFIRAF